MLGRSCSEGFCVLRQFDRGVVLDKPKRGCKKASGAMLAVRASAGTGEAYLKARNIDAGPGGRTLIVCFPRRPVETGPLAMVRSFANWPTAHKLTPRNFPFPMKWTRRGAT